MGLQCVVLSGVATLSAVSLNDSSHLNHGDYLQWAEKSKEVCDLARGTVQEIGQTWPVATVGWREQRLQALAMPKLTYAGGHPVSETCLLSLSLQ